MKWNPWHSGGGEKDFNGWERSLGKAEQVERFRTHPELRAVPEMVEPYPGGSAGSRQSGGQCHEAHEDPPF